MSPRFLLLASALLGLAAPAAASSGLDPAKALTQYGLDVWMTEQGLPQNTVTAVTETGDGYLWVGTYDGLARFDGIRFTVFDKENTPALKSNGIRALCADGSGGFWVGTNTGGLARYTGGHFERYPAAESLTDAMVWALATDRGGGLWIGTNEGALYYWSGGVLTLKDKSPSGEPINAIREDRSGTVWVATHGRGLKHSGPDGTWTALTTKDGLPSDTITSLLEDQEGSLWLGTVGAGLARWKDGHFTSWSVPEGLPSRVVWDIRQDGQGVLWIATGQGLARFRDGRFEVLGTKDGLPDDVIYSLHEDREGSLWVGTNGGGLSRLRNGKFTTFTTREGLANDYVYSIYEAADGSVWVGTSGGVTRLKDRRFASFTTRQGLGSDLVRSIDSGKDGTLWVGTYGGGVSSRTGETWRTYTARDGLADDSVRAVRVDRAGAVWAGTVRGLSRLQDGRFTTFTTRDGLSKSSIICLDEDREGSLWIGTDGGGLCRHRDGRFACYGPRDGLASGIVLSLLVADDGVLWVGTNGGLSRLRDGHFTTFTTASGLPADAVYQILDDGAGNLWLGGSHGISRVSKKDLDEQARRQAPVPVYTLGRSDGLKSLQCAAPATATRSRDGRLWFATAKGVAVLDPAHMPMDVEPPPVVIEDVEVDNRTLAATGGLELPPGTARIAFRYTGLCLLAPDKVSFRFKMEGFDPDWMEAGPRRVAYYTNLAPGAYRFRVVAGNGDGAWNEQGASLSFRLRPHFYQTGWFWTAAVMVVALAALGVHRLRMASLHASARRLSLLVEERTRELERQKAIAEGADRMKTELLEIASHDLKNPLQLVMSYAELLTLQREVPADVAEMSDQIFRASRRMFGLVDALLTTAALDGGNLTLSKERVDVGRLATTVVGEAKRLADRKQQTVAVTAEPGCVVLGDEDRLRDVMDNLLTNAIKYSPAGKAVRVAVAKADGTVRLEVRDEGLGLTADDRGRLFKRFGRTAAVPTGGETSTGLGLFIVKRLVELHGGRVWADSPGRDQGSTFVVELPAAS